MPRPFALLSSLLLAAALAPLHAAGTAATTASAPGEKAAAGPARAAEAKTEPYCRYDTSPKGKGDFEVLVRRFRHPETGREVTLAGMIHLADPAFYAKIDSLGDRHDVVLLEGVKGSPTFFSLPLIYTAHLGSRLIDPAALEGQNDHLRSTGPNRHNADVTMDQLGDRTGVSLGLVSLPFVVVGGETAYALETVAEQLAWLTGNDDSLARASREMLADTLVNESPKLRDEDFDRVILRDRNTHVLEVLDGELRKPGSRTILIPWGAAHHPGLEQGLRERGFEPVQDEWLTAVAVRSLGRTPETDPGFRWRLPYAMRLRFSDTTSSVDGPLSLLAYHHSPRSHAHSSLWGLLHSREVSDTESSFSLLGGIAWSGVRDTEKGERERSALAWLWRESHSPLHDATEFGWWGFLGASRVERDDSGREESSSWHLPLTFGRRPLLYREEVRPSGETVHRFLLFFKTVTPPAASGEAAR